MQSDPRATEGETGAFAGVAKRRFWVVLLVLAVALGSAWVYTSQQQKQYKSTAVLLFKQVFLDVQLTGVPLVAPSNDPSIASATNVGLISQANVRAAAAARLGGDVTPASLKKRLKIEPQKKSDLIGITATASTPKRAATIANTVANAYLSLANEQTVSRINAAAERVNKAISSQSASPTQRRQQRDALSKLKVLAAVGQQSTVLSQAAVPPTKAASPNLVLNLLIGLAVGLVLGLALAALVEYLDKRLRSPQQIERESGLPVLATVPKSKVLQASSDGSWRRDAEPLRQLANRLKQRSGGDVGPSVLVVGPGPGSGATTVAAHLALVTAEDSADGALLVEADLRRPELAQMLGVSDADGLTRLTSDTVEPPAAEAVLVDDVSGRELWVVPAGDAVDNPGTVLSHPMVAELIAGGRDEHDLTVVDGLSPLYVADVLPLLPDIDAVVIVARLGRDTGAEVRALRTELERQGADVVGVVANFGRRQKNPYSV